jgi:hypothetical protein
MAKYHMKTFLIRLEDIYKPDQLTAALPEPMSIDRNSAEGRWNVDWIKD